MAVTRVGEIFNYLVFGGVDSRDYNVYITGEAVFDAPTRAVEAVTVPGRNGDILIDQGHWNNINVTYKCGIATDGQSSFSSQVNKFRNALASQLGYVRLEDSYNPAEYRLGNFQDGISVSTIAQNESGEFTVTFFCKPQRFLKSGEGAVSMTSGQVLDNPTLYPASPLIFIASGYGTLSFNDGEITIENGSLGEIEVGPNVSSTSENVSASTQLNTELFNSGDTLMIATATLDFVMSIAPEVEGSIEGRGFGPESGPGDALLVSTTGKRGVKCHYMVYLPYQLNAGTSQEATYSLDTYFDLTIGGTTSRKTLSVSLTLRYDAPTQTVTLTRSISTDGNNLVIEGLIMNLGPVMAISSKPISGNIYIDTEVGEVYRLNGTNYVNLNKYVSLGSDLPKLASGENIIEYDNTMSGVEITPRYWEL